MNNKGSGQGIDAPSHFLTPRLIAMCIAEGQLEFLMEPLSWGEWGILRLDLYERYGIYSERYAPIREEALDEYLQVIKKDSGRIGINPMIPFHAFQLK